MAVKIKFDESNNVIHPTFVLATRSGRRIGAIPAYHIVFQDCLNTYSHITFSVSKSECTNELWNQLVDLKLLWYKEANAWFEIQIDLNESTDIVKEIDAKSLGESELSQAYLYNIEINTENDILREDYEPTVLFKRSNPGSSLLDRITEKVPHYSIAHVDDSIRNIQRTYTFDNVTIYDALQQIAEEINCLFEIECSCADDGHIRRNINVYDLETVCLDCGTRYETDGGCPSCGSDNIQPGYGDDTTIFVAADNLAEAIEYTTDVGSVKNCFRLVAGDDLMTATIVNCNPNGSQYIWYFSDEMLDDMPDELVERINEYNKKYEYYQSQYVAPISLECIDAYNALVDKYSVYSKMLEKIPEDIIGFPALMTAYYNTIDFNLYLSSGLMPDVSMQSTSAAAEAMKLTPVSLSPVAVTNLGIISEATASSAVLSSAKVIIDSRYRVKVNDGATLTGSTWRGSFVITNYSDESDTATSEIITVTITDDYNTYVRQKIEKAIDNSSVSEDVSDIQSLFSLSNERFESELKKYCLSMLTSFHDACEACLSVLIEQGAADKQTWASESNSIYDNLYVPYREKLALIEAAMLEREAEINAITGSYDEDGYVIENGLQVEIIDAIAAIAADLDFEGFIGEDLWSVFTSYRREDTYSNDNYISDGLDNAMLFSNALEFLETAKKEIYKSATMQHSISARLKDLLVMKEFAPITDYFAVGNWLRVCVDGHIYKLRLLDYEIDFDDLDNLNITFSDVTKIKDGISDNESIAKQVQSMASSYESVSRQASKAKRLDDSINGWYFDGFQVDNLPILNNAKEQDIVWNQNGILLREFLPEIEEYDDRQLRIINRGLYLTDDKWDTSKAAIGNFYYKNPKTGAIESAYGVNGELIVGELILGNELGIYTRTGKLTFDEDGLRITNDINTFIVNPNSSNLLTLQHDDENILWVDEKGTLHIRGDGAGLDISANDSVTGLESHIEQTSDQIHIWVENELEGLGSSFTVEVDKISGRVSDAEGRMSIIEQNIDEIQSTVKDDIAGLESQITQTASSLESKISDTAGTVSRLEQTVDGFSSSISGLDGRVSSIQQSLSNIKLSVSGSLGGTASITLDADGTKSSGSIDMSDVRQAFADDKTAVTISGGTVTFNSNTFVVNSTNFSVSADGTITAKSGKIGSSSTNAWNIGSNSIYNGPSYIGASSVGTYVGIDGFYQYKDSTNSVTIKDGRINAGSIFCSTVRTNGPSAGIVVDGIVEEGLSNDELWLAYISSGYSFSNNKTAAVFGYQAPTRINGSAINMQTTPTYGSDRDVKKDVLPMSDAYMSILDYMEPVVYRYEWESDDFPTHGGYIAQDMAAALEKAGLNRNDFAAVIGEDGTGEMAIAYTELIPLLHLKIKNLEARIKELEQIVL